MLEPTQIARALEHLGGGSVQLAQSLDDLRRRLSGVLLARQQPAVQPFETAVDLLLDPAETVLERFLETAQSPLETIFTWRSSGAIAGSATGIGGTMVAPCCVA